MDAQSSEVLQLVAHIKIIEERLAQSEEVLRGVMEKISTEVEESVRRKLSFLIPNVKEMIACNEISYSILSKLKAQHLSAHFSSVPAIASLSNFPPSLKKRYASTAARNRPAHANQSSSSISSDTVGSLIEAAGKGDLMALNCLMTLGDSINARDKSGNTTLHMAASNGCTRIATDLIASGAAVDRAGNHGRTPLHCAAANGHLAMVARLVAAQASVHARDARGATAVDLAAIEGYDDVVQFLFWKGASIDSAADNGETSLMKAVRNQRIDDVKSLLRYGASPTIKNHKGESALTLASAGGHMDILKELLEMVPQSEKREIARALTVASSAGVIRIFADVAQDVVLGPAGEEACHAFAREGHHEALEALLQLGVNVNAVNKNGSTGLHWAAVKGHASCVRTLLKAGARVNVTDILCQTPLKLAANEECFAALKESGAV